MSGAHKVRVLKNYRPPGVRKKFCEYYEKESPPPFGSPSGRFEKNQKIFPEKPSLCVRNKIISRRQRRLRVNSLPMRQERKLILLNGHLVTLDEYREWIKDQQR